jgi:hypothetical protein
VRISHRPRLAMFVPAVALGLGLLVSSLAWAVPSVDAGAGPANVEASEFVRLINGVRGANGLGALRLDPTLVGLARDTSMTCPGDPSLVMYGRARDGAENSYVSHYLRLCPTVKFVSILQSEFGYGNVGEIMLQSSFGTGEYLMSYQGSAALYQTNTYAVTGNGMLGWMSSGSHAPIILGGYDRVGCGGWMSGGGVYYFDCIFSSGGPNGTTSPPNRAPFPGPATPPPPDPTPVPTPKPTPVPVRVVPVTTPVSAPTGAEPVDAGLTDPTPGGPGTTVGATEPAPAATLLIVGIMESHATTGATPGAAAAGKIGGNPGDTANGAPVEQPTRDMASVAGLALWLLSAFSAAMLLRRRRRRTLQAG